MKTLKTIATVVFFATISACATIPQESVGLSNELGMGIKKQHQAQVNFLNLYFESKRKDLDAALQRAVATYFATIAPAGSVTLSKAQLSDVAADVLALNDKNNAAKQELESVRIDLVSKLEANYLTLNQANSTITGLLQSAVSVKEATNKSTQLVASATGGRINLDKIFSEIDSFVVKGGVEAGKAIKLKEKIDGFTN